MSIAEFPAYAREHWPSLRQALLDGSYQPAPLRQQLIPKPDGRGWRHLRIPTVLDRVILQAIQQVLTPRLDPGFSESSHGYRPRRSAHGAVKQVQRAIRAGCRIAVDLDLETFFDRVDFDVLMARLGRHVADQRLLRLIGRYLRAGVVVDGQLHPTRQGIPQGSPLSPLLANLVLDDLDRELERRGHRFVRYADDVVILVGSQRAGQRVMASIARFLRRHLKLEVNVEKSQVMPTDQLAFLGFSFRGTKICWSAKTMARFGREVRRLTNRNWGVSMARRLAELERYRLKNHAVSTGRSSRGPWRLARTQATQLTMSNGWLAHQGLVSVKDLGSRLLIRGEPPSADPHAGWWGGAGERITRLPDWPVCSCLNCTTVGTAWLHRATPVQTAVAIGHRRFSKCASVLPLTNTERS